METLRTLMRAGKIMRKTGAPNALQGAVLLSEYRDEYVLARPPRPVQRALFGLLAPMGMLLGYRARHTYPYPVASSASAVAL